LAEAGLFVATNPTTDASFTLIRGAWVSRAVAQTSLTTGLLANRACRSLYISDDGSRGLYTIDADGLYRWTNGNIASATRIFTATNGVDQLLQVCVSQHTENNVLMLRGPRSKTINALPKFSTNFGSSFADCVVDLYPGGAVQAPDPTDRINAESGIPVSSPHHATTFLVSSNSMYKTTDGLTFNQWQNGYNGMSVRDISMRPTSTDTVVFAVDDYQAFMTRDRGMTVLPQAEPRGSAFSLAHEAALGNSNFTGIRCLVLSDGSFLIYVGRSGGASQLVRWRYVGPTLTVEQTGGNSGWGSICLDADGVKVYAGKGKSSNMGASGTWSSVAAPAGVGANWHGVCGASPLTTGVVWGAERLSFTSYRWFRSANGGATSIGWELVAAKNDTALSISADRNAVRRMEMWPHPTNNARCFVHTLTDVYEIGTDLAQPRSLGVAAATQTLHGSRPLLINTCAVDYNDGDIIYVGLEEPGFPVLLRTENASNASPTWVNACGHTGYSGGILASGGISAAAGQSKGIGTGEGVKYPPTGIGMLESEIVRYTISGNTATFTERGLRGTTAATHAAGVALVDLPELGFIPYAPCQALDVHRGDGTVVVGTLGDGVYAVAPPTGYTPAGGFVAGELFKFLRSSFA
jgi:hypothetical protein